MPRINWSSLQTILMCVVLLLVLLAAMGWIVTQISRALLLFALASVLALVVAPLVDWAECHKLPRWLAAVAIYLLFAAAVVGGLLLLISPLLSQAAELGAALPDYVAAGNAGVVHLGSILVGTPLAPAIDTIQAQVLTSLASWSRGTIGGLVDWLARLGGSLADAVLLLIISMYLLIGGKQIYQSALVVIPAAYREHYLLLTGALTRVLGGYVRSQLVSALLLGVAVTVGMYLLGLPYPLLLGMLATVLGIIPMFGSALSAVAALLVAMTQPFPTVLWVLIFFIVVQNVQDQVVAPRLQGESLGLHPLAVMFALLAGAQIAGALGAMLALPVAGCVWIVVLAVYRSLKPAAEPLVGLVTPDSATSPRPPA